MSLGPISLSCVELRLLKRKFALLQEVFDDSQLADISSQISYRNELASVFSDHGKCFFAAIRDKLAHAPYVALIRDLPASQGHAVLAGIAASLGEILEPYRRPGFLHIREIRPRTDRQSSHSGILNEVLHTDGTDWPTPNCLTCLFCVASDENGGGISRLLDLEGVYRALSRRPSGRKALDYLRTNEIPWRLADEFGGGTIKGLAFSNDELRWLKFTNIEAFDNDTRSFLPEILETAEGEIETADDILLHQMKPGDVLLVNNFKALHARTPISHASASERLVLRAKIRLVKPLAL